MERFGLVNGQRNCDFVDFCIERGVRERERERMINAKKVTNVWCSFKVYVCEWIR